MRKINSLLLFCFLALSWQIKAQISTFPYSEDFEANDGGFVVTGTNGSWAHGVPAGSTISSSVCGTQAWVTNLTGTYNNSENSQLESPEFDFSGLTSDPILRFDHNYETESCCDEGWVEFSTDAGATWNKLGTASSGSNWYNDSGNDWWDNSSSGWRVASHPLTGLAGEDSVKIRFVFSSDGSVTRDGFAVDNIFIGTSLTDHVLSSFITPSGQSAYGSTESVSVSYSNSGTATSFSVSLCYVLDNGTPVCQTFTDSVTAGASTNFTFTQTADLSVLGAHTLSAYVMSANDITCNDTINTSVTTLAIVNTFPYIEDFEASNGDWSATGTNASWAHGVPSGGVISSSAGCGTQAWVTNLSGSYNNSENSQLESPTFDFSGLTADPVLRFDHNYETEGCCDEGWVEVSTDGGATWNKLGTASSGISNWYNDSGNDWWDNNSSGWRVAAHTLTGMAGQSNAKIRFVFSSDGSVTRDGFAVDNIVIAETLNDPLAAELIQPASLSGGFSASETIEMSVTNAGTAPITFLQVCYVLDGGAAVCDTFTVNIAPLATDSLTFTATADLSVGGAHTLDVYVGSMNDYVCNDTLSFNLTTILCPIPTSLSESAITSSGATLSWMSNGTSTEWEVRYDVTGGMISSTNSTIVNNDTFLVASGLTDNTDYQWYVREICGVGDSSAWSTISNFTTPCAAFTAPFSEDFSGLSLPACWSHGAGNSENWEFQLNDGHIGNAGNQGAGSSASGGGLASVDDSSPHNTNTTLESPMIDISGLTTPRLTFYTISDDEGDANGNVDFHVDVFDGAAWNDSIFFSDTNSLNGTWEKITVDLSGLTITGPIQIRFVVDENNGGGFDDDRAIDDVVVEETPSCLAVSGLNVDSIAFTLARVSWTDNAGATEWEVEWDTTGYAPGTSLNSMIATTNPMAMITGLMANTTYDYNVRAICAAGDSSAWVGSSFFTGYCTPAPTSVDGNGITNVSFDTVNNTTGAEAGNYADYSSLVGNIQQGTMASVDITYETGFTYGTKIWIDWNNDLDFTDAGEEVFFVLSSNANPTTVNASFSVPVNVPLGQYRMRIGGADNNLGPDPCYTGSFASFEDYTVNVQPAPACLPPGSQTVSAVTATDATLSWVENGTATQWEVEYGAAGFAQGTGTSTVVNTDTFLAVTGLTASTQYEWYVRAICSPTDSSTWVGASNFTTAFQAPLGVNCTTGNPTVIFSEEFDNNNAGWTGDLGASGGQWEIPDASGSSGTGPSAAHSGSRFMNFEASGGTGGTVVSPAIDLTNALSDVELSFWLHAFGSAMGDLDMGVGTSPTGPFTSIFFSSGQVQTAATDPWQNIGVNLSAYIGQTIYISLNMSNYSSYQSDMSIDLFEVSTCANCAAPTQNMASAVTDTDATLSWIENGTATQWEVQYDTAGFTLGTGVSTVINTDTFTTVTGLTGNTSYDWYVRAICGPMDTSSWTNASSFRTLITPCPAISATTLPFIENWENNTGTVLGNSNVVCGTDYTWTFNTTDQVAGRARFGTDAVLASAGLGAVTLDRNPSGAVTANDLILTLDLAASSAATDLELLFDFAHHGEESHANDRVWIRGSDSDTWVEVYDTYANRGTSGVYNVVGPIDIDAALAAASQSPSSTFQIRFGQEDNFPATSPTVSDGFSFDNIVVRNTPSCFTPSAFVTSQVTTTGADISWSDTNAVMAPEYQYSVVTAGSMVGTGTQMVVTTDSVTVSGLMSSTAYDWYVRAICGAGDTSLWSSGASFTTLCVPFVAPFSETFDGLTTPVCWSQSAVQGGPWVFGTSSFGWNTQACATIPVDNTGNGGNFAALDFSVPDAGVVLELPDVDVTALASPYFEFYYTQCNDATFTPNNVLHIEAFDGTAWNTVDSITRGTNGWEPFGYLVGSFTYNTNLVKLRFRAEDGGAPSPFLGDMGIDDVSIIDSLPPVPLAYYPIGTINTEDATTGIADSLNVNCAISGTVVGVDKRGGGYDFVLIDMSSGSQEGITVFDFNDLPNYTNPTEGDSLYIEGTVSQFRGLTQFSPDSINIISTGAAIPAPIVVTNLDESTESKWLSIPTSYWALGTVSGTSSANLSITNGTDTLVMRIDSDTDILDSIATSVSGAINVNDTICGLFGTGGQFSFSTPPLDAYQIFPMRWSDLTICRLVTGIDDVDAETAKFTLNPNPTRGEFEIRTSGFNNPTVNVIIRDLNGRIVSNEFINNANNSFNKSFNLNGESKGVYFITITDGEDVINEKLILQ